MIFKRVKLTMSHLVQMQKTRFCFFLVVLLLIGQFILFFLRKTKKKKGLNCFRVLIKTNTKKNPFDKPAAAQLKKKQKKNLARVYSETILRMFPAKIHLLRLNSLEHT